MSLRNKVLGALAPFDVKAHGQDRYRMNSPYRPGSNSHAFVLTFEGDDKGTWYDHVEGNGGSLYELAKHLGLEVDSRKPVASTKRQYSGLEDYAKAHGVPVDILNAAQWKQVKKNGRPALEFPTRSGARWRFIDGEHPVYISVNGYTKCWYGFNEPLLGKLSMGQDLIICNGEISTVVAQAYGLAAVSVTSGEGVIPDALMTELKQRLAPHPTAKIVVALDCDDKGRKATEQVYKQLVTNGFNASAVDLGLTDGGDLADWLTLYGWSRMGEALADFPSLKQITYKDIQPRKRWEIIHASQLANLPPVKWLIKGQIPDNGITVIYGASGAGKSFVTLDYALRVAQMHPVVYVAAEGEAGYHSRIQAWCEYFSRKEGQLFICLGAVSLLDAGDTDAFIDEVTKVCNNPRLIIVDTLARSMLGGDENSARDMGQFVDRCDLLRQKWHCGVVIVHHSNKAGIVERGSGALRGAADSMIRVTNEDDLIIVECAKSKDYQPFEPIYKRLQPVDIEVFNSEGERINTVVAVDTDPAIHQDKDGLTRLQRKVLTTAAEVFEYGFTMAELGELMPEVARPNLYRVISRLRQLGYITQPAKRDPFEITDKATSYLQLLENSTNVSNVSNVSVVTDDTNSNFQRLSGKSDTTDTTDTNSDFEHKISTHYNDNTQSENDTTDTNGKLSQTALIPSQEGNSTKQWWERP